MKPTPISRHLIPIITLAALSPAFQPDLAAQTTTVTKFHPTIEADPAGTAFGVEVAMNQRWIVVGVPGHKAAGIQTGAIHVFDAATGRFRRRIVCPEPQPGAQFGLALAIEGDRALIAAQGAGTAGKAYLMDLRSGALLRTFVAPMSGGAVSENFGAAVALGGGKAVIGDNQCVKSAVKTGCVFVYDLTDAALAPTMLVPNDASPGDEWGISLSLSGNLLLGGAPKHNASAGAAYLFDISAGTQLRKIGGTPDSLAGVSVALAGGLAAVGAPGSDLGANNSGRVRVHSVETGLFVFELVPNDPAADQFFGYSLAANHDLIIVGAIGHALPGGGINAGAAYAFDARTGGQLQRLLVPGRKTNDFSGFRVAVSAQKILVGCPFSDDLGSASGSAALFSPVAGRLSLSAIATQLDAAPGLVETTHAGFGDAVINQTGRAAFTGSFAGPGAARGKNRGAFTTLHFPSSLEMIIQSGHDMTGFGYPGRRATAFSRPLISETPVAYFQTRQMGAGTAIGGNLQLFAGVKDGPLGVAALPLIAEGDTAAWAGGARVARIGQIVLASNGAATPVVQVQLRPGTGNVTLADDTRLGAIQFDGMVPMALNEGTALSGGGHLGQIQRAATASDLVVLSAGIQNQPDSAQGIFGFNPANGTHTELARQGTAAFGVAGATHQAFLGETISLDQWVLHRGTVAGPGVTAANREALWLRKPMFTTALVARAGSQVPGLASGVVWSRFLQYWVCNDKVALVLGQVRGPGVNASNDLVLWMRQEDGSARVLLREGNTLPGSDGARVAVIQRVTLENKLGAYSVLASLRGAPRGRDQVLMQGRVGNTILALGPLRVPFAKLVKGGLYQNEAGVPLSLTSMNWSTSINDATGAGAKGLGNVINPAGLMTLHTRFSDRRSSVLVGKP
jgi:hypothetical protein